jgi:Ca2+-binding EF-hand superfamily protein
MSVDQESAAMLETRTAALEGLFKLIDTDGSGTIEQKELKRMIKLVSPQKTDEEIAKAFRALDDSKDGKLQKKEFVSHYLKEYEKDSDTHFHKRIEHLKKYLVRKPVLGKVFDKFDGDRSGTLDRGEIYRMVKLNRPHLTNEDVTSLMKEMDIDHDKKISKDEFVTYYFKECEDMSDKEFEARIESTFKGRRQVKLEQLFNMYDLDASGFLDVNEFMHFLTRNGRDTISSDDAIKVIGKVDKSHDHKIQFDEWMDYMSHIFSKMDDDHFNVTIGKLTHYAQNPVDSKDRKKKEDKKKEDTKKEDAKKDDKKKDDEKKDK